jgi:hypothetical protein
MQMGRWLELARSIATHPHTRQRAGGCHGLQANWDSLQLQLTLILLLRDPKLQFFVRFPSFSCCQLLFELCISRLARWLGEKKVALAHGCKSITIIYLPAVTITHNRQVCHQCHKTALTTREVAPIGRNCLAIASSPSISRAHLRMLALCSLVNM